MNALRDAVRAWLMQHSSLEANYSFRGPLAYSSIDRFQDERPEDSHDRPDRRPGKLPAPRRLSPQRTCQEPRGVPRDLPALGRGPRRVLGGGGEADRLAGAAGKGPQV